jgi:hypothetical protein
MQIGSIERVMIDKRSGKVSYGLLRPETTIIPLRWGALKYDTNLGGYRADITEKQLQAAPKCSSAAIGIGPESFLPEGKIRPLLLSVLTSLNGSDGRQARVPKTQAGSGL